MGRKGKTGRYILAIFMALPGCTGKEFTDIAQDVRITLECPGYATKASLPEEDVIRDLNILIFENGRIEESIWREEINGKESVGVEASLVIGRTYTIAAIANLGRRLEVNDQTGWNNTKIELQESDGYRNGIPMSAIAEDVVISQGTSLKMELIRLAAKISLKIDRSRLSEDVKMEVKGIRIGNCPRYASLSPPSKAGSRHDVFETGFELTEDQCVALNSSGYQGLSGEVSVYMLENMQGEFPHIIGEDEERVLEKDDPLAEKASFIEIEMDYKSSALISYDSPLLYRFYLGDSIGNLDVERNCHYRFTIIPEDDGLAGNGWRVDKSGIGPSTPLFIMHPGDYVEGHVGDTLHIWCECYPKTAPFDPGYEELDFDKSRGIYDYKIDGDGPGVTLYLKKAGTGIVYMSAGYPINKSGMTIVRVMP